jgi:methylenetetrahydrofolate dehydrogenase (NADP+)/methenyltetrahydrofolate cyclohydrolase
MTKLEEARTREASAAIQIDGRALAAVIRARDEPRVRGLLASLAPRRAVLYVRSDRAESEAYRASQERVLRRVGLGCSIERFDEGTDEGNLVSRIRAASEDPEVVTVSVHQPLPRRFRATAVLSAVTPTKDIEGTHPENLGRLDFGEELPAPCAARAVLECLRQVLPDLRGKHVVVIGRSALLGRPLIELLLSPAVGSPTITICHTGTVDLASHTRRADVLLVAAGRPHLVTREMTPPGAVVIDAGTSRVGERLVGDVDTESVATVASAITPVPGGVGPVTSALLLSNLAACLERQRAAVKRM